MAKEFFLINLFLLLIYFQQKEEYKKFSIYLITGKQ